MGVCIIENDPLSPPSQIGIIEKAGLFICLYPSSTIIDKKPFEIKFQFVVDY